MNKAILMGRLTRDPELKKTANDISVCTFSLAIDRNYKNKDGERQTDFIPVVVWRQQVEFVSKYFSKGQRMLVVGSIQPRSYEDQVGQKRYITEVIAEEVYFADSKHESNSYGYLSDAAAPEQPDAQQELEGYEGDTGLPFDM